MTTKHVKLLLILLGILLTFSFTWLTRLTRLHGSKRPTFEI